MLDVLRLPLALFSIIFLMYLGTFYMFSQRQHSETLSLFFFYD